MQVNARHALLTEGWAEDVRLTIERGRIARVETGAPRPAAGRRNDLLIPGLCNAHSHAFQRALVGHAERRGEAGQANGDTFWTWRQLMYRLAGRMDADSLHAVARQLYIEMLASGYTAVVEFHYLHAAERGRLTSSAMADALLAAADDSGIRLIYLPVLYERADFGQPEVDAEQRGFYLTLDNYLAHVERLRPRVAAPHRVGLGAHSLRTVSAEALRCLAESATEMDLPLHVHIAEQQREVDACIKNYGAPPVRWLLDHADVDSRWTLVHATHSNEDELADLAGSGAVVCLCPSTEGNLGDGFFSLQRYLEAGGAFSIGSDSHVTVNPFEELRWLEYGQRLKEQRRNVAADREHGSGGRLFLGALAGGARAAGGVRTGLEVDAEADLLRLNGDAASLAGHGPSTWLDALVMAGLPLPVDAVMVNGRWVIEGGVHPAGATAASGYATALSGLKPGQENRK